jgi:type IV pilus biogenesis protein CpaD/CtpE
MKNIILACLAGIALAFIAGCASDGTHSTTTTSQQTTVPGPISTTTTDTQTK